MAALLYFILYFPPFLCNDCHSELVFWVHPHPGPHSFLSFLIFFIFLTLGDFLLFSQSAGNFFYHQLKNVWFWQARFTYSITLYQFTFPPQEFLFGLVHCPQNGRFLSLFTIHSFTVHFCTLHCILLYKHFTSEKKKTVRNKSKKSTTLSHKDSLTR